MKKKERIREIQRELMQTKIFKAAVNAVKKLNFNISFSEGELLEVLADYFVGIPDD